MQEVEQKKGTDFTPYPSKKEVIVILFSVCKIYSVVIVLLEILNEPVKQPSAVVGIKFHIEMCHSGIRTIGVVEVAELVVEVVTQSFRKCVEESGCDSLRVPCDVHPIRLVVQAEIVPLVDSCDDCLVHFIHNEFVFGFRLQRYEKNLDSAIVRLKRCGFLLRTKQNIL